MTLGTLYTIIGIKYDQEEFVKMVRKLNLIDEKEFKERQDDPDEENSICFLELIDILKLPKSLSLFQFTHDIEPDSKDNQIVLGLLISKRIARDAYADTEAECDDNTFTLEEITEKYNIAYKFLEEFGIKHEKKDIKMYMCQNDCRCCS